MLRINVSMAALAAAAMTVGFNANAAFISGATATASSELGAPWAADGTVNGDGLDDANAGLQSAMHTNFDATTGWITAVGTITDVTYEVDLGGSFDLDEVAIWNFIQGFDGGNLRGSKDVTISTSTDGAIFTAIGDVNGGTIGTHTLTIGPNSFPDGGPQGVSDIIGLGGVTATHVRIFIHNGHGDTAVVGLNEVRFYDVPEPGSLALLGLGGLALLRRRRA